MWDSDILHCCSTNYKYMYLKEIQIFLLDPNLWTLQTVQEITRFKNLCIYLKCAFTTAEHYNNLLHVCQYKFLDQLLLFVYSCSFDAWLEIILKHDCQCWTLRFGWSGLSFILRDKPSRNPDVGDWIEVASLFFCLAGPKM